MNYRTRSMFLLVCALALLLLACSKPTPTNTSQSTPPQVTPGAQPAAPAPAPPAEPRGAPKKAAKPSKEAKSAPATAPTAPKAAERFVPPSPVQPNQKTERAAVPPIPSVPNVPIHEQITLPVGTVIPILTIDSVDSRTNQVGETFRASIDADITQNGETLVPKGADARLKLTSVTSAGAIRGKSELQIQLDRIVVGQNEYVVVSDIVQQAGAAEGKKTVRDVGIGAAIGALIGGITGGKKGAAIGAGVGAGSGMVAAVVTKGEQVVVPSEARLEFKLQQPLRITVQRPPTR